jgi:hypothetical protein
MSPLAGGLLRSDHRIRHIFSRSCVFAIGKPNRHRTAGDAACHPLPRTMDNPGYTACHTLTCLVCRYHSTTRLGSRAASVSPRGASEPARRGAAGGRQRAARVWIYTAQRICQNRGQAIAFRLSAAGITGSFSLATGTDYVKEPNNRHRRIRTAARRDHVDDSAMEEDWHMSAPRSDRRLGVAELHPDPI